MFYVVVREIEGGERWEVSTFVSLADARLTYANAEYVCDNGPDDLDALIISQCWPYEVDADDPDVALAVVRSQQGRRIASYVGGDYIPEIQSLI